jgi:hypothetical protein
MSFLTDKPDLTNTIFSDEDLQIARRYLSSIITKEDPRWLKKPLGVIGQHWKSDTIPSHCFLIDMAQTLYVLDHGVTAKSQPRLQRKFRDLLRSPDEQFQENYNELQVGRALAEHIGDMSGLAFLEPEEIIEPVVTRCPDFAFRTPDGDVMVEASVFYGGTLDTWTKSIRFISAELEKYALANDKMIDVQIFLPLQAEMEARQIIDLVIKKIDENPTGQIRIGKKGIVRWMPVCIIPTLQPFNPSQITLPASREGLSSSGILCPPGATVKQAFISQKQIAFASEEDLQQARELLLKSFRLKLREKRGQFLKNEPEVSLLILQLEYNHLIEKEIANLLYERIWTNKKEYDWLSGLILFTPRSCFQPSDPDSQMVLYPNPHTYRPITPSLKTIFNDIS